MSQQGQETKTDEFNLLGGGPPSSATVFGIIFLRYLIEILLGICAKGLYKSMSINVPANLFLEVLSFFPIILMFNKLNRAGVPFLPKVFGGKWSWSFSVLRALSVPGLFTVAVITLKQTLIKDTGGPGYTEMLTGISLSIGVVVQYYVNGIKTGWLGCAAASLCLCTALIAGVICGARPLVLGALAALCNVCRSSFLKRKNKKYRQCAGQNLLYSQFICLPVLLIMAIFYEWSYSHDPSFILTAEKLGTSSQVPSFLSHLEIGGVFCTYFGFIPFFRPAFCLIVIVSMMSNIIVLVLFDLCSPLTYLVAAQMKGIVQVCADVFYVDYLVICAVNALVFLINGNDYYLDAQKYKNSKPIVLLTCIAIGIKCSAAVLYVTDKGLQKRKTKLNAEKNEPVVAEEEIKNCIEVAQK